MYIGSVTSKELTDYGLDLHALVLKERLALCDLTSEAMQDSEPGLTMLRLVLKQ